MTIRHIALALLATTAAASASAAPTYYTDPAAFAAAAGGTVNHESFENPNFEAANFSLFDHLTISNGSGFVRMNYHPSDGLRDMKPSNSAQPVTALFDHRITAFGIDVIGLGSGQSSSFNIDSGAGDHELYSNYYHLSLSTLFAGVIDPDGFTSVSFHGKPLDDLEYDLVRSAAFVAPTGGVPEPASWAMLIAGFGLVGAVQRRRTRAVAA